MEERLSEKLRNIAKELLEAIGSIPAEKTYGPLRKRVSMLAELVFCLSQEVAQGMLRRRRGMNWKLLDKWLEKKSGQKK